MVVGSMVCPYGFMSRWCWAPLFRVQVFPCEYLDEGGTSKVAMESSALSGGTAMSCPSSTTNTSCAIHKIEGGGSVSLPSGRKRGTEGGGLVKSAFYYRSVNGSVSLRVVDEYLKSI